MSAVRTGRKRKGQRESAEAWSERMGRLCDEINAESVPSLQGTEGVPLTPGSEGDLKAAMLASMRAMRLHIDRLGREKRIIALHAASSICPEGKEGCPLKGARPPSDCASCWEIYAAKKINGG